MRVQRLAAVVAVSAMVGLAAATGPAHASPARPSSPPPAAPAAPTPVFTEDFEQGLGATSAVTKLAAYTGASSETYTADAQWLNDAACNGFVGKTGDSTAATSCAQSTYNSFGGPVASAIGTVLGGGAGNHALMDFTSAATAVGTTLKTNAAIPLSAANHFITFSADVGVTSCSAAADPLLHFWLLPSSGPAVSLNATDINPCSDPRISQTVAGGNGGIRVGRFAADTAIQVAGNAVGFRLDNDQPGSGGNDYAVDNIQVLDATPQLTKDFATPAVDGQPDVLTFTITNTSDLASKNGWSFTDNLPAGMTIAATPNASTTCANTPTATAITAAPGDSSIAVTGNLATGQASCTVSVSVVAPHGTYTNGSSAGNVTTSGLLPAPDTTVTVIAPPVVNDLTGTTSSNTPITFDPVRDGGDTGVDGATLDLTTVTLTDPVTGNTGDSGHPLVTADGTYTVDPTSGAITFTPNRGFVGTVPPISYAITDSNGLTSSASVAVTVRAPVLSSPQPPDVPAHHGHQCNNDPNRHTSPQGNCGPR